MKIVSQKIRDAARDENCTLNIVGACNYNPETVVLCHFPDEHNGTGTKPSDLSSGFGCSGCHDAIDRRNQAMTDSEMEWYMRRSQCRTLARLIVKGVVAIKGVRL